MLRKLSRRTQLGNPREHTNLPRSGFLAWLGVGLSAVAGGIGGLIDQWLSTPPVLASVRPRASISWTMPVVSRVGLYLGNARSLRANQALSYTDPKSGEPAILIRLTNGRLVSYDIVCPHLGCSVPYDPVRRLLVCPCHGAQFDPARQAAPLRGPVSQPLIGIPIRVDGAGNVFALDALPGTKVNRLRAAPKPSSQGDDGSDDAGKGRHSGGDGGGD